MVGKPNPDLFDVTTKKYNLDRKKCLMVGDRLDSDILIGKRANVDTFGVLTGVSTEEDFVNEAKQEDGIKSTYYWDRVEV